MNFDFFGRFDSASASPLTKNSYYKIINTNAIGISLLPTLRHDKLSINYEKTLVSPTTVSIEHFKHRLRSATVTAFLTGK